LSAIFCQSFKRFSKGFPKVFRKFSVSFLSIFSLYLFFVSFLCIFSARKDKEKIQRKDTEKIQKDKEKIQKDKEKIQKLTKTKFKTKKA